MKNLVLLTITVLLMAGCSDFLDVEPTDRVTPNAIFTSNEGVEAFLATLYRNMPIEDFNCAPHEGLNWCPADANHGGIYEIVLTDDAISS